MRIRENTNINAIFVLNFWEKPKRLTLNEKRLFDNRTFCKEIKAYLNDKKW